MKEIRIKLTFNGQELALHRVYDNAMHAIDLESNRRAGIERNGHSYGFAVEHAYNEIRRISKDPIIWELSCKSILKNYRKKENAEQAVKDLVKTFYRLSAVADEPTVTVSRY